MSSWLWPLLVIVAVAVLAVGFVKLVFVCEAARRRLFPVLRPLYKHVFNPSALQGAARGETRWGVLHHVGRRSGAAYNTPIDAQRTRDGVIICLVYGPNADWCRNVLAAGRCTLTLNGQELALASPQVISLSEAEPNLLPERAGFWRSMGIEHCLYLPVAPEEALSLPKGSSAVAHTRGGLVTG
jgi:deazaflavin-dependent oxidoreductase (nitroreductase family)